MCNLRLKHMWTSFPYSNCLSMINHEEAKEGVKIAGKTLNNLRYADDTTLMARKKAIAYGKRPEDWKKSTFIPIFKKGDARSCDNYRTIALISHTSKILLKIIHKRMESTIER